MENKIQDFERTYENEIQKLCLKYINNITAYVLKFKIEKEKIAQAFWKME